MKKILGSLLIFASLLLLTACGEKITTEDLKANDWLVESAKDDEPNMILSFSDHVVSFNVDTSTMKSTSNGLEAIGEGIAKKIIDQMSYKIEYVLEDDVLTLKNDEGKNSDAKYTVSKENKNLVLTPEKSNKSDDNEKLVLKPYKKNKDSSATTTSTSSEEQSSSTTDDSIIESSSTVEQNSISQNVAPETSSTYSAQSVENFTEVAPSSSVQQITQSYSSSEDQAIQETVPSSSQEVTSPSSSVSVDNNSTITAKTGEGPKEIAARAGITVDQLFALNGIDPNNYFIYPGQEFRIK